MNRFSFLSNADSDENEHISTEEPPSKEENEKSSKTIVKKRKPKNKERRKHVGKAQTDDDIERIIADIHDVRQASGMTTSNKSQKDKRAELLKIDPRSLNSDTELRRLLGKALIAGDNANQQTRRSRRPVNVGTAAGKLVKTKPEWPALRHFGVYMTPEKLENDAKKQLRWFQFHHNDGYQSLQQLFWLFQRTMDHESIMNTILASNPYHLDGLLTLAEILRVQEDAQHARDTIGEYLTLFWQIIVIYRIMFAERGLFACEAVFHSTFQVLSPEHRLSYSWRENRAFYILLHWHLFAMIQRRCFFTALQFAKIIFIKDPDEDPLAILLLMDSLALRAKDANFVVEFYAEYVDEKRLDLMPNWLYSQALAHYFLSQEEQAIKALEFALTRFPFVLGQILDTLQIQPDPSVDNNYYLNALAFNRESEGLRLITRIYIHHNLELWRQPEILSWLESATHAILPHISANSTILDEWVQSRQRCFVGLPRNVLRHATLFSIRIGIDQIPESGSLIDPFPPANTQTDYWPEKSFDERGNEDQSNSTASIAPVEVVGSLIRSLMPEGIQPYFDSLAERLSQMLTVRSQPSRPADTVENDRIMGEGENPSEERHSTLPPSETITPLLDQSEETNGDNIDDDGNSEALE